MPLNIGHYGIFVKKSRPWISQTYVSQYRKRFHKTFDERRHTPFRLAEIETWIDSKFPNNIQQGMIQLQKAVFSRRLNHAQLSIQPIDPNQK